MCGSHIHDRLARQRLRLFADALSAEDRFSHAWGSAAKGAGDSRALGEGEPLCATARERPGSAEIRPARRPALTPTAMSISARPSTRSSRTWSSARTRWRGRTSNYVPGWDCHGLPIEWKVEEEFYRAKGKVKPDFSDSGAIVAFRRECRAYAEHWLNVQREEFKRLGVVGDWDHPYTTMSYPAEAQIARELFKFVANGLLYRGSKPVMWSVVEKTALAEAEVEYEDYTSDTVYVAFPVEGGDASVVIWTTTPWTIPGNRAIAFSKRIAYGRYRVAEADADNWAKPGATYILAKSLAETTFAAARVKGYELVGDVSADELAAMTCAHPAHAAWLWLRRPSARRRACDGGRGHGLRPHRAWPRPRGLRAVDRQHTAPAGARDRDAHPLHGRRGRRPDGRGAGLHGAARPDREGREGRRQRRRHQDADRGRRADRARQAQAPVSA